MRISFHQGVQPSLDSGQSLSSTADREAPRCRTGASVAWWPAQKRRRRNASHRKLSRLRQIDSRVPLVFGAVYRHVKPRMITLDDQRSIFGFFVRRVSGLQLPVNRNVKLFRQCRLSSRSCCARTAVGRPSSDRSGSVRRRRSLTRSCSGGHGRTRLTDAPISHLTAEPHSRIADRRREL